MSARSILIYPEILAGVEENGIFCHPKRLFWKAAAPKREMMWYEGYAYNFFRTLRIFYVEMATSEGGGAYP